MLREMSVSIYMAHSLKALVQMELVQTEEE
jgi:hypothetical protein